MHLGKQIAVLVVVLAWVLMAGIAWPATYLAISGGEPGQMLACLPVEPGTPFCLEFINSIYAAPVRETFVYEAGQGIFIIKVESPSAGVFEYYGLEPDGSGVATLRRPIGDIIIRSHDYEHHRLMAGDKVLRFKGLIPDGERLVISVRTGENCKP